MGEIKKIGRPVRWKNLRQQTLPAFVVSYNSKTLPPIFLGFGLILIPLGVTLFVLSRGLKETTIDYTDCTEKDTGYKCADVVKDFKSDCKCVVDFTMESDMQGTVRLYYALTNFYQNHREYVKSRDDNQLLGKIGSVDNIVSPIKDCSPLDQDAEGRIIFPCGAIANSMFNDTFKIYWKPTSGNPVEIPLIRKGIAWDSDKEYKFRNPNQFIDRNDPIWDNFTPPRDWNRTLWDLDPEDPENNGLQNEDFIVWMRTAALPSFRKLHRIVDLSSSLLNGTLPKGSYSLEIQYEYEVKSFGGTKSIVLMETSTIIGGRNESAGIISMTTGSVILVLGLIFLCGFVNKKKSWSGINNKNPSTRLNLQPSNYGACKTEVID